MKIQDIGLKNYDDNMKLLDALKGRVERGEVLSISVVAELTDGSFMGHSTPVEHQFGVAGFFMYWPTYYLDLRGRNHEIG